MESTAFRGMSNLNLDAKGRLSIPARYRDEIMSCCEGKMIITVDFDFCLMLYPYERWLVIEKEIAALPSLHKTSIALKRFLIGYATDITMDKGGRMLIPPPLRDIAKLDKQVVLVGQGHKFEIWDEVRWHQKMNEDINKDDLIGDMGTLSF